MIIVGLLLLAAAVIAAIELIVANDNTQVTVHMWRWSWTVDAFWLAVAGAAILMAGLLGLFMVKAGSRRARRLRRERRELAKENRQLAKRAEVAEATGAQPVRGVAPHGYNAQRQGEPVAAGTTTVAPTRSEVVALREQTHAGEQVGRNEVVAPREQTHAGEQVGRNEVVAPREQTYAGEQMDGRHVDR